MPTCTTLGELFSAITSGITHYLVFAGQMKNDRELSPSLFISCSSASVWVAARSVTRFNYVNEISWNAFGAEITHHDACAGKLAISLSLVPPFLHKR